MHKDHFQDLCKTFYVKNINLFFQNPNVLDYFKKEKDFTFFDLKQIYPHQSTDFILKVLETYKIKYCDNKAYPILDHIQFTEFLNLTPQNQRFAVLKIIGIDNLIDLIKNTTKMNIGAYAERLIKLFPQNEGKILLSHFNFDKSNIEPHYLTQIEDSFTGDKDFGFVSLEVLGVNQF